MLTTRGHESLVTAPCAGDHVITSNCEDSMSHRLYTPINSESNSSTAATATAIRDAIKDLL